MEEKQAQQLFDETYGTLASAELLQRLVLFFECLGFLKQQANAGAFLQAPDAFRMLDLSDDYLQLVLQQARDEGTAGASSPWFFLRSAFSEILRVA